MLVYESDGFLEADDLNVEELYRSTATLSLPAPDGSDFELQAALCLHKTGATSVCQAAFYCRALKRALIFGFQGASAGAGLEAARTLLENLGFSLEQVKLNLSPALRQVVLRDIAGLQTPAEASRQRSEKAALLAAMEMTLRYEATDSPAAKKARHVLSVEQRYEERAGMLRKVLEAKLAGAEKTGGKLQQLAGQIGDLTARLERALALSSEERRKREHAETILMSAENRIRELENSLVDFETKAAANVKSQAKVRQLNKRVKELQGELTNNQEQSAKEAAERSGLIAELVESRAQLENHAELLARAEKSMCAAQGRNEQLQADNTRLQSSAEAMSEELQAVRAQIVSMEQAVAAADALTSSAAEAAVRKSEQLQSDNARLQSSAATLREELHVARSRIASMEQALASAGSSASASEEAAAREAEQLRQQLAELQRRLAVADAEASRTRTLRADLEARATADQARIGELEQALAASSAKTESKTARGKSSARKSRDDVELSEAALIEALAAVQQERLARETAETALDDAHRMIDALEKALKDSRDRLADKPLAAAHDEQLVQELNARLRMVEGQLEQEAGEGRRVAKALVEAERRLVALDGQLRQAQSQPRVPSMGIAESPASSADTGSGRRLPHELRPAPPPGALFRPDWDLSGLPCDSAAQILQAWESPYNVQLSLEGYPSQYCSAFLVLLKEGSQKRLYLLYNLKKNKHILVCVPGTPPRDEAALKKLLAEVQNFLKRSGFEMAKMPAAEMSGTLGAYFRKTGG